MKEHSRIRFRDKKVTCFREVEVRYDDLEKETCGFFFFER